MALAPVTTGSVNNTTQTTDAQKLTTSGEALKNGAAFAAQLPLGPARAAVFGQFVLPTLLGDAAKLLGADATKLGAVLEKAVTGAGATGDTLGLKNGDKGLGADTDYPPRAANAVWGEFAAAAGISAADAAAVTKLNEQIGSYPKAEGKYAPAFEQLGPALQELVQRRPQFLVCFRRLLDYSQHGWRLLRPAANRVVCWNHTKDTPPFVIQPIHNIRLYLHP